MELGFNNFLLIEWNTTIFTRKGANRGVREFVVGLYFSDNEFFEFFGRVVHGLFDMTGQAQGGY